MQIRYFWLAKWVTEKYNWITLLWCMVSVNSFLINMQTCRPQGCWSNRIIITLNCSCSSSVILQASRGPTFFWVTIKMSNLEENRLNYHYANAFEITVSSRKWRIRKWRFSQIGGYFLGTLSHKWRLFPADWRFFFCQKIWFFYQIEL